jgi:hypothetical protein
MAIIRLIVASRRSAASFSLNWSEDVLADEPEPELVNHPSDIDWRIPGYIQRRIGAAIVACSTLEHTLEIVIWAYLKLNSEDGKMLTSRMEMNRRQAVLKDLMSRYSKNGIAPIDPQFWEMLQVVIEQRNKVAHGVWITAKGRTAIASTKWRRYQDFTTIELYSYETLAALEQLAYSADGMFRLYIQRIGLPHIGFAVPPHRAEQSHQQDHQESHTQTEPPSQPQS